MAAGGDGGGPGSTGGPNPAPEQLQTQVFVLRQVLAILFVLGWLLLFAGELVTGAYALPFWYHCVAVGVLAYSLGLNVAELTAFRPPLAQWAPGSGLPGHVAATAVQAGAERVQDRR